MDYSQSYYIIKNLANKFSEDPELLEMLRGEVNSLENILKELKSNDIKKLLNKMDKKTLSFLIKDKIFDNYAKELLNKNSYESILEMNNGENEEENINPKKDFFKKILDLDKNNEITYNGRLKDFIVNDCIKFQKNEEQGIINIITDKQSFNVGEDVKVHFVGNGVYRNTLKLFFYKEGKRYYNKEKKIYELALDDNGYGIHNFESFYKEGIYKLYVEEVKSKKILGTKNIIVGISNKSKLKIEEINRVEVEETIKVELIIKKDNKLLRNIKYTIICSECGNVISGGIMEDNILEFRKHNHKGDFLIFFSYEDKYNLLYNLINNKNEDKKNSVEKIVIPDAIYIDEKLKINIKSDEYQKIVIVASDRIEELKIFKSNILSSNKIKIPEKFDIDINEKISDTLFEKGLKMILRNDSNKKLYFKNIYKGNNRFCLNHNFISDIQLDFYVLEKGNVSYLGEKEVKVKNRNFLRLDFPYFINEGEIIEGKIKYYANNGAKIKVINRKEIFYDTEGFGEIPIKLNHSSNVKVILEDKGKNILKVYKAKMVGNVIDQYKILKKGDCLKYKGALRLFESIEEFKIYIILKGILAYKWGCSEQTSSKLNALAYLLEYYQKKTNKNEYNKILKQIEEGFLKLDEMRNQEGSFTLWGGNGYTSDSLLIAIYSNIRIYKNINIEIDQIDGIKNKIINELETKISEAEKIESKKNIIETENKDISNTEDEFLEAYNQYFIGNKDEAIEYFKNKAYLQKDNTIIYKTNSHFINYKYSMLFALEIFLIEKIDKINIISYEEIEYIDYYRNNFDKFLKKIRIKKREKTKKIKQDIKTIEINSKKILNEMMKKVENGLLGSTQLTSQLMRLLELENGETTEVFNNNKKIEFIESFIRIKNPNLLVKNGAIVANISYFKKIANISKKLIEISSDKREGKIEEQVCIKIKIDKIEGNRSILKVYMPGIIDITDERMEVINGVAELPVIDNKKIILKGKFVRKGNAKIICEIRDMYGVKGVPPANEGNNNAKEFNSALNY